MSTFRKIGGMRIRQICASERIIFSFNSKGETQAEQFIRTVPKYKQALPPVIDVEFYANKKDNPPKHEDVTKEFAVMIEMLENITIRK